MRHLSMRDFRTRGPKALGEAPPSETILLTGQKGPAYFLIPVLGDVALEERELRRAMAKASLRESWRIAAKAGLDKMTDGDIQGLVKEARAERKKAGRGKRPVR